MIKLNKALVGAEELSAVGEVFDGGWLGMGSHTLRFEEALGEYLGARNVVAVNTGTYRTMIHEMREMVAQNMGQYAHCNEPCHHVLYLYDYAGQPWKTQVRVRQVMNQLYQSTPDGLCGDEDTGQTSAWYVLSALGIYPVCPGDPNYAIGSPLFKQATISRPHQEPFVISAPNNGPQRPYIHAATLNGQPWNKVYLSRDQIAPGGKIEFDMVSSPDYKWGASPENRPPVALPRQP